MATKTVGFVPSIPAPGDGSGEDRPSGRGTGAFKGITPTGGAPQGGVDLFFVQRSTGVVQGPFSREMVSQMLKGGKLTGQEQVSRDRATWTPMLELPEFADGGAGMSQPTSGQTMFGKGGGAGSSQPTSGNTMFGKGGGATIAEASFDLDLDFGAADPFGGGGPAAASVAAPAAAPAASAPAAPAASGNPWGDDDLLGDWSTGPHAPGVSNFSAPAPGRPVAGEEEVSGVRRLTPAAPADFSAGLSQLPLGGGISQLGLGGGGDDAELPLPRFASAKTGLGDLPAIGGHADLPAAASPRGLSDLPGVASRDLPSGFGESGFGGGFADLPGVSGAQLPGLGGTNLPGLGGATNLPGFAGTNLPGSSPSTNLPGFAGTNLPGAGPSTNLPGAAGLSGFGDPAAPRSGSTGVLPASGNTFAQPGGGPHMGSSTGASRAVGTQMMSAFEPAAGPTRGGPMTADTGVMPNPGGQTFSDPSAGRPRPAATGALPATPAAPSAPRAPATMGGGVGLGAPTGLPAADPWAESAPAAEPPAWESLPGMEHAPEPPGPDVAPARERVKQSRGVNPKLIAAGGILAVLVGAGVYFATLGPTEPTQEQPAKKAKPVVTAAGELGPLSDLRQGGYKVYAAYVDKARAVLRGGQSVEARAQLLVASALMYMEHPERRDLREEMGVTFQSLEQAEATPLVQVARGAFLAVTGDEGALPVLALVPDGEYTATARVLAGLLDVSSHLGWEPSRPAPSADGSGAAAEPPPTEKRRLGKATAKAFDDAFKADAEMVAAVYWRGWVALEIGEIDAAEKFFTRAVELNPNHVGASLGLTRALIKRRDLTGADARIARTIQDLETESSPRQRSESFMVAAEIAIARMQTDKAIEALQSALQHDSTNGAALQLLGDQFFESGQYDRALEYFESNKALGRENPDVIVGVVKSRYGLRDLKKAEEELKTALEKFPTDARFPYYMGLVREEQAEFEEAQRLYQQALQLDPDTIQPQIRLARIAQRGNQPAEAVRLLDESMSAGIRRSDMANEVGETYLLLNQTNRAIEAFNLALSLDASNARARLNLTRYFLSTQQHTRALNQLDEMVKSGVDTGAVRFLRAGALRGLKQYDKATEEMLALLEKDANNPQYLMLLGQVHFDAGNWAVARENLSRAYERSPGMDDAMYFIARCDIELDRVNDAVATLTALAQRNPSGEYQFWLGRGLEKGQQPLQAQAEYDKVIRNHIGWALENPEVFVRRAALYYRRGLGAMAFRDLRIALTLRPQDPVANWMLGRVEFDRRNYDRSIELMNLSLSIAPEQPEVHYLLGQAWLRLRPANNEKALEHFEKAREGGFGERRPDLYQRLGLVYRDLNRRNEAISSLKLFLESANLPYEEKRATENEIRRLGGTL